MAHAMPPPTLDRRTFLKSGAAAGLVIAVPLAWSQAAQADPAGSAGVLAPDAFVRVAPNDTVTIMIKHHEMGQGATTGLATIAADELDADWSKVVGEYAPSNPKLYANLAMGVQGTGGSTAIANSWEQMRKAGALARAMLVQAAADAWKVPASEIKTSNSVLTHASGKRARYGEMAGAASKLTPPTDVKLKDPSQFTLIGKDRKGRLDSVAKSTGTATYTIDVKLPGLLTAVIARPPAFGAKVKSFDATDAKQVKGVTDVVQVPEGVAVVGTGMWAALQGRKALKVDWDLSGVDARSSQQLFAEYRELAKKPGVPASKPEAEPAKTAPAARSIEAVYEFPYLAHAAMEPMNCVAWLHDGQLETFCGHQFQTPDHMNAAKAAGLSMEKVTLHTLVSGGSFGRRANADGDFIVEAVHVAKAINGRAPVRVQRTREDDMRAGYYRPLYVHAVKLDLDAKGNAVAWQHTVVGQSIIEGTPFAPMMIKDGVDPTSVEGASELPYAIPNHALSLHSTKVGLPVLWWRSVGSTHTAYVVETLIDEIAVASKRDPVELRLALMKDKPRHVAALKLAADKAGWNKTPARPGVARGVALHESFNTVVAQIVDVRLVNGLPKVDRVVVGIDCGTPVNPDVIRAQMEGCVGFALSAALYSAIDLEQGGAKQSNFHDYQILRIPDMPKVEVYIVPSQAAPTGVGEPGVPPLAPAVANALYRLTGKRVRSLPFARQKLQST
ncbi:MAG: molybdopterin cofactor-binding domain-containing protein [Solimonas sp.]